MIPFRITKLTKTAKLPHRNCESDLWDLYANDFCIEHLKDRNETMFKSIGESHIDLAPMGRVLVKTGISLELPIKYRLSLPSKGNFNFNGIIEDWFSENDKRLAGQGINNLKKGLLEYAVADIRPRSDNLEQKGLFIENKIITGGEVSFVAINHGHEPITISKGDVIAKMLICSAYPSKMEVVDI